MGLRVIDYLMGVGVALAWGMGFVFAKAAIAHFPPILLMSFRFAVTALALVWFVRPPIGQLWSLAGIAVIAAAIQYSLTFTGLKGLDASVAVLVVQLEVPFLVMIGGLALGERVAARKWAGIALAFLGVILLAGEPKVAGAWISLLLVMSGAFAWAVGQAFVRRLRDIDGLTVTAWMAVFAAPQLLVMSLLFESEQMEAIRTAGWIVWTTVAYLGLVMTALGYTFWNTLVRRHPISAVAPFLLLLPVFSTIAAVIFLGEKLTAKTVLGGAVILSGLALILVEPRRRSAKVLNTPPIP